MPRNIQLINGCYLKKQTISSQKNNQLSRNTLENLIAAHVVKNIKIEEISKQTKTMSKRKSLRS
jgi:hypothetical protein